MARLNFENDFGPNCFSFKPAFGHFTLQVPVEMKLLCCQVVIILFKNYYNLTFDLEELIIIHPVGTNGLTHSILTTEQILKIKL